MRLLTRGDPDILSVEARFDYIEFGEVNWFNMSRVMLEISDYPGSLIDLDESRRYIIPRLVNIFKT